MPDRTAAGQSSMAVVLFTDLVESTALMTRLGDAPFDELRGEHMARLARSVERHGGTVVKNTGDGVMATAEMLARRSAPGDADRARRLVAQALETAGHLGLGTIERRGRALQERL